MSSQASDHLAEARSTFKRAMSARMDVASISNDVEVFAEDVKPPIKEEPVEIKVEDVDEFHEQEVKQEEPDVDLFCPSTGESRPLFQPNIGSFKGNYSDEKPSTDHLPSTSTSQLDQEPQVCSLCDTVTTDYIGTSGMNLRRRAAFLTAIVTKTMQESQRIYALRGNKDDGYFCLKHVGGGKDVNTLMFPKCDFCDKPEPPFRKSPRNPVEYRQFFFDNLVNVTAKNRERIDWFLTNPTIDASVCGRHNEKVKCLPPASSSIFKVTSIVKTKPIQAPKMGLASRLCDICCKPADKLCLSPADPTKARKFFGKLITTTYEERRRINVFLRDNECAAVCKRHWQKVELLWTGKEGNVNDPKGLKRPNQQLANGNVTQIKVPQIKKARTIKYPLQLELIKEDEQVKEEPIDGPGPSGIR